MVRLSDKFSVIPFLLFSVIIFTQSALPQNNVLKRVLNKIDNRIKRDFEYLNVFEITCNAEGITAIEEKTGKTAVLRNARNEEIKLGSRFNETQVNYKIGVIGNPLEVDSLIFVYIYDQKIVDGDSSIGRTRGSKNTYNDRFMRIADLFHTRKNYPELYSNFTDLVLIGIETEEFKYNEESAILKKMKGGISSDRGKASTDNSDHISFLKYNGYHFYPQISSAATKNTGSRQGTDKNNAGNDSGFCIDASFSHISFAMKELNFGPGIAGLEINTKSPLSNTLPWQLPALNIGLRFVVNLSGTEVATGFRILPKDLLIEGKILARIAVNTPGINANNPFLTNRLSKLNTTSGVGIELTATSFFRLPIVKFFFSIGSDNLENPLVRFSSRNGKDYAFFNSSSWSTTFNFYWVTSSARTGRFRFELGFGQFNILKQEYANGVSEKFGKMIKNDIYPILGIDYNFIQKNSEVLGLGLSYFDSRLRGTFWLKVFTINEHVFRLETEFISSPFLRTPDEWETTGGVYYQLRYRYGL